MSYNIIMKYGFGNISMWASHYNAASRTILRKRYGFRSMLIVDFIRATENNRRQKMHGRPYKKTAAEKLQEAIFGDGGWDKCHLPVRNIFKHNDAPENCPACGGIGTKRSTNLGPNYQSLACIECGIGFVRPVRDGVIITGGEFII